MNFKKIVDKAFQSEYQPLTAWQKFAIEQALDFVETIDRQDDFNCKLGGYSSPIRYSEREYAGEKTNQARISIEIGYQNKSVLLDVNFTEQFKDGRRKAKCSVGLQSLKDDGEFDLSSPNAVNSLLSAIAVECGKQIAIDRMKEELNDEISRQRLILRS